MTNSKSSRVKRVSSKIEMANSKTAEALIVFMDAGLMPLEDFKGVDHKWESRCMKCDNIVSPRFADIKRGKGGCKTCSSKSRHTPEFLENIMQIMADANLEPLEPYKNANHKWQCKCLKCGEFVTPTVHNLKAGNGGCIYCQVAAFKHNESAYLYLIHHQEFRSFKVGIGNTGTVNDRIDSHMKSGWQLLEKYSFEKGSQAIKVEKLILSWIRNEKGLPPHLTNNHFKHGGATETFSDESITALEIKEKIKESVRNLRK